MNGHRTARPGRTLLVSSAALALVVVGVPPVAAADPPAQTLLVQADFNFTDLDGSCAIDSIVGGDVDSGSDNGASLDLDAVAPDAEDRGVSATIAADTGSTRSGPDVYDLRSHDLRWTYRADATVSPALAGSCGAQAAVQVRDEVYTQPAARRWLAMSFAGTASLFQIAVSRGGATDEQILDRPGFAATPVEAGVVHRVRTIWAGSASHQVLAGGGFVQWELLAPGQGFDVPSGTGLNRVRVPASLACSGSPSLTLVWKADAAKLRTVVIKVDDVVRRTVPSPQKGQKLRLTGVGSGFDEITLVMKPKRGPQETLSRTYAPCGAVPAPPAPA